MNQMDLFSLPAEERIKIFDQKIARVKEESSRVAILRSFIYLHLHEEVGDSLPFMQKRLACLQGKSLLDLIDSHWEVVLGWMKEIRMNHLDRKNLTREYEEISL